MFAGLEALRQSGKLHKARIVGYKGGLKLVACCPFHDESTPSFAAFDDGGYHCLGCGASGVISRTDGSEDDLMHHLSLVGTAEDIQFKAKSQAARQSTELEPALLHRAYETALAAIPLGWAERHHLLGRGLSLEDVEAMAAQGYRSAPRAWPLRNAVAEAAVAAVGPEAARSLPFLQPSRRSPIGFTCTDIPGLLVPVRNAAGQIIACKVRLVDQGKSRFLWWKARHSSASTGAPIHVSQAPGARLAVVVEGPIKADVVALLWPRIYGEAVTVLAIPGASAHAGLVESLSQLGLSRVVLALDPDPAGRKASEEIQPRLERAGFSVETSSWPEEFGKIDDFLANQNAPHSLLVRTGYEAKIEPPVMKPFATMEAARAAARPWLQDALTGPRGSVYHMALEMGGGKTHLAVQLINELYESGKLKGQVGLFTTRHEQGEQFEATQDWARHYGATYGFENGEPTAKSPCKEPRRMLTVVNSGAPTKLACELCPQRPACVSNFARDPGEPFLLAQKATMKDRHLYNANSLRDPSVIARLSTLLLDDLDLERTLVDHVLLDLDQLKKALLWSERDPEYAAMRPLLKALWVVLPSVPAKRFCYDAPRLNGEALQNALATELGGLDRLLGELESAVTAKDPHPLSLAGEVRADVPHRGFVRLAQRLLEELRQRGQTSWNPMVHLKPEGISVWTRARVDFTGKTVILLNASHSAEQYQRVFPGATVQVFHGRVVMPQRTKVAQIPAGPYTLKGSSQLVEIVRQALQKRQAQHPAETPADWGLVASSKIREAIEEIFPGINARHYGNQTGSNEMESVRFLIVAGDFKPNPHGFLEEAQALWGDAPRLDSSGTITAAQIRDKTGKSLKRGRRGYQDPRLDARWLELTGGEVRQAVGRGRPWNTGQHQPEQGEFLEIANGKARHLDVVIFSSYLLEGIVPDQLSGERADLEDVLSAAAVKLRQAGLLVTLASLRAATGISDRQIRERLNRVKLRSEAEWLTLNAALGASPAFNLSRAILTQTFFPPAHGGRVQRRGPPAASSVQHA